MARRLTIAAIAALGVLLAGPPGARPAVAALPDIGDPSGELLSPAAERRIGQALLHELRRKGLILDDPVVDAYLRRLGARLVTASGRPASGFTFFVVRDRQVNAFAAPGGHVGVHTGLIVLAERESELAGVLAHEIAHVTQRHLARTFEAARRLSLPMAAAMLAAALIGTVDAQAGHAALAAGVAGLAQKRINFTRDNEREADRIGIEILTRAGISGEGLVRFFERLDRQRRLYGTEPPEFLSTHPVSASRIADARARLRGRRGSEDSLAFQIVRARVDVLTSEDPLATVRRYRAALAADRASSPSRAAARYGLGLALAAAGRHRAAIETLGPLVHEDPDRIAYRTALAEAHLAAGEASRALAVLDEALVVYPGNPLLVRARARALLAAGRADEACRSLVPLLRPGIDDPALYRLYARTAQAAGLPAEAHRAQAEVYFASGQPDAAIEQLELALRLARGNAYQHERISARLREVKAYVREMRAREH